MRKDKWEVGRKVRIVERRNIHDFNLGDVVEIVGVNHNFYTNWFCKDQYGHLDYIHENEGVLIEDNIKSININGKELDVENIGKVTIDGYQITIKKDDSNEIKKGDLIKYMGDSHLFFDYADHQHSDGEWVGKSNYVLGYDGYGHRKVFKATQEEIEFYNKTMKPNA